MCACSSATKSSVAERVDPAKPAPDSWIDECLAVRVSLKVVEAGSAIRGGVEQPLKPGDVLYVPPGVPHGFKDVKGFRAYLIRFDTK